MSKAFGDDNYQPDNVKAPVKDDGTVKIGDQANPTICKLVVDPRRPQEAFRKTVYHRYMNGPDPRKDGRFMVSRKMLQDKDPINDAFWDAHNQLKELAKAGKDIGDNATDPEVRKLKGIKKTFANHDRFHLLLVPLNANKPKVCTTVGSVVDLLFGKEAWGNKAAIKGLVNSMKDLKRNPFNLKIETGWIKLWKTGEGIETRYYAEEYMVDAEMTDPETGETATVKRPFKAKVNPAIFELDIDDVPDLSQQDLDKDQMVWTAEECEAFVASFGKTIPERCKKKERNTVAQESDQMDPNYNPNTAKAPWEEEQTAEPEATPAPVVAAPKATPKPAAVKAAPKAAPAAAADLDSVF
jgi:hypothetical protein